MRDPRVKKMASYLELTNSSYLTCLKTLFRNLVTAITEARDITLYLKTLEKYFTIFGEDFLNSKQHIRPLFHTLALIWVNSKYYCNSSKVIFLLEQFSNLIIEACTGQLDPSSLFQVSFKGRLKTININDALKCLRATINKLVCSNPYPSCVTSLMTSCFTRCGLMSPPR